MASCFKCGQPATEKVEDKYYCTYCIKFAKL